MQFFFYNDKVLFCFSIIDMVHPAAVVGGEGGGGGKGPVDGVGGYLAGES
jgi:hypothetical protein